MIWRQPSEELRHNLNNPFALVNHNLVFSCETKSPDWFEVYGGISTNEDGTQVPYCTVSIRRSPPNSKIPASLSITTTLSSKETNFVLISAFNYPYHFEFVIPESYRSLELNSEYPSANITIDTNEELLLADSEEFVEGHYNRENRQQTIKVDFTNSKKFYRSSLRIRNPITGQHEAIAIRYDPEGRGKPADSSWSQWKLNWTDYIVGLMLIILILAFANWQAEERPKTL